MSRTPYSDTAVPAGRSKEQIEALFNRYGVTRFGIIQNSPGEFEISFVHKDLPVRLPFSSAGLAASMLKEAPWSERRTRTKAEYESEIMQQAAKAVWRHAAAYLKATFEAVHYGILSFEQAFLHGFVTPDGKTLGQAMIPRLREVSSGVLALPAVREEARP